MPDPIIIRIVHSGDCPIKCNEAFPPGSCIIDQQGHRYDLPNGGVVNGTSTLPINSQAPVFRSDITIQTDTTIPCLSSQSSSPKPSNTAPKSKRTTAKKQSK